MKAKKSTKTVLDAYNEQVNEPIFTPFSDDELRQMALEMIYQITGERVPENEQCRRQGAASYQIAMAYLEKVNNKAFNRFSYILGLQDAIEAIDNEFDCSEMQFEAYPEKVELIKMAFMRAKGLINDIILQTKC